MFDNLCQVNLQQQQKANLIKKYNYSFQWSVFIVQNTFYLATILLNCSSNWTLVRSSLEWPKLMLLNDLVV